MSSVSVHDDVDVIVFAISKINFGSVVIKVVLISDHHVVFRVDSEHVLAEVVLKIG